MAPKRTSTVEGADGKSKQVKSPALKRQGDRLYVEDIEMAQKREAGEQRAMGRRRAAAHEQTAATGFNSVGVVATKKDKEFINQWLTDRPQLIAYVCSLMRNGLIEGSFNESRESAACPLRLGKKVLNGTGNKYRNLPNLVCIKMLGDILGKPDIASWFKGGEDKVHISVASKALRYCLAVESGTSIPKGHKQNTYENPLICVFSRRWLALGRRLALTTKETIDRDSDYFYLGADGQSIFCTLNNAAAMTIVIDMKQARDWQIRDPSLYRDAMLISESLGFEGALYRMWERSNAEPEYNTEFNFPAPDELDDPSVLDFGKEDCEGSSASSSVADARVAAAAAASPGRALVPPTTPTRT